MMLLLKTCFPGIIRVFMCILVTEFIPMTKQVLEILPGTLSVHVLSAKASLRAAEKNDLCSGRRVNCR